MARTAEEFNLLYEQNNGDPWGYDTSYVIDRLDQSIRFVSKHIPLAKPIQFVEFGPFDGSFTRRIVENFENAKVLAVEISDHAVTKVRRNIENLNRNQAQVVQGDIVNFDLSTVTTDSEQLVILALECIYYLSNEERAIVIDNWASQYRNALIFISGPINQFRYLDESWLIHQFDKHGWRLIESRILTLRHIPLLGRLRKTSLFLANALTPFRKKFANQCIFVFQHPSHSVLP